MARQSKRPAGRTLNLTAVRAKFPALKQVVNGTRPVYLDNPGGTQVAKGVLDAMRDYMIRINSNSHGAFHTSHLTDQMITDTRKAMADFLNAPSEREIVFGANMTTLTLHMSRAIAQTLPRGSEIVITRMDHDANISPWMLIARDQGFDLKWVDFDPKTGRLDYDALQKAVTSRTKLVACGYASNALGTINDVKRITQIAHDAGAMVYVDAVQYAPHGPIDVQEVGCDFLVCSAYKFFGPHIGVLYGMSRHLENLPAYKVRPAPDEYPDRWETGTQNHEGIAGTRAAVEYFEWLGEQYGKPFEKQVKGYRGRRRTLKLAMAAIKAYEKTLSQRLIDGLSSIKGVSLAGITRPDELDDRVPTIVFNLKGRKPSQVAAELGQQGIYVWDGNYYALAVMEHLGFEATGGMVRVGAAHYNTRQEIDRFLKAVDQIASSKAAKPSKRANGKAKKQPTPDLVETPG